MYEYFHSSFPERKRSLEYTIFSKMKSYLKWSLLWKSFYILELFEGIVVFELGILLEGVVVFELVFIFELVIFFELFDRASTFRINLVVIELSFVFELFKGVVIFELFNQPSTFRIDLNFFHLQTLQRHNRLKNYSTSLRLYGLEFFSSSNSSKAWSVQLTLQSAVSLRHATFQAFYMHFGTTYRAWANQPLFFHFEKQNKAISGWVVTKIFHQTP